MQHLQIRGVRTRVWKNAPPTLAVLAQESRRHGQRVFGVFESERVSYEAHFRAVAILAQWLLDQGVGKSDRVALAMSNLPEWSVIFFAATCIGAIVVPLNAWFTGAELAHILNDSGAIVLFCDTQRHERITPHLDSLPALERVVVTRGLQSTCPGTVCLESLIGHPVDYATLPDQDLPRVGVDSDDVASLFYTSGTTGSPKGALGTHRNILTHILSSAYSSARNLLRRGQSLPATPVARVRLITVPLFHVTGCVASLISGMPAANTNIYLRKWDALQAMDIIERERVNIAGGVPTMVWQMLDHPRRHEFDLSSLEMIAFGGAPAGPELARRIRQELGAMPAVGWGLTETTSTVTALSAEDYLARPDSCGPPVPVADLKVMDVQGLTEASRGQVGEVWVRGPMIANGYWNRPEATAATFHEGWVRTGDLGRLDKDGFCYIVDRLKDVIIRGGENIYCAQVEQVLQEHPAVVEAALIGLPHRVWGEEPAAVVSVTAAGSITETELREWVRARLASFKAPVRILCIEGSLPRNAGGKLLKSELHKLFHPPQGSPS